VDIYGFQERKKFLYVQNVNRPTGIRQGRRRFMSTDFLGLCQCGCGSKTAISNKTENRKGWIKGEPKRYIQGHGVRGKKGKNSNRWKGGIIIHKSGYILVKRPEHHRAYSNGYVFEHILIMEKLLGRPVLPNEAPHHRDGNRANNSPGNLTLFKTHLMHHLYHARLNAFISCGNYEWRQCGYCHNYDDIMNMTKHGRGHFHANCRNIYRQALKNK
jgi:hypothetical protein